MPKLSAKMNDTDGLEILFMQSLLVEASHSSEANVSTVLRTVIPLQMTFLQCRRMIK